MTNTEIIDSSMKAYNGRDIESFMHCFSDDIIISNFADGTIICSSYEEVNTLYQNIFEQSPHLHSTVVSRIVFDNKVIDHEHIIGRLGLEQMVELVLIYEIKDEKISKIIVLRTQ